VRRLQPDHRERWVLAEVMNGFGSVYATPASHSAPSVAGKFAWSYPPECDQGEQHQRSDCGKRKAPPYSRHPATEIERPAHHERTDKAARVAERRVHRQRCATP